MKSKSVDRLYAVCVVFNPHNFKSRIRLYKEFAPYIEFCGAKLLTVEIAFGDRPFEVTTPDNKWNIQLRTNHVIWHKERAFNIAIKRLKKLAPKWNKVALLDADVSFSSHHWVKDAIHALDHYKIIQLFSQAAHLNAKEEILWYCRSVFHDWVVKKGFHQNPPMHHKHYTGGHPGLAWAIRRDAFQQLEGLLDFTISGSGDLMMANALMGNVLLSTRPGISPGFKSALEGWQKKCDEHIKGNVGFIHGVCLDHWHGKSEHRGYEKRWDIMNFHQFDPATDIVMGENGLWEWAGNKHQLEQDIRLSTMKRNEDSIDD